MTIGSKIKFYRNRLRLTQKELAKQTGLSENAIQKYEQGARIPKMSNLKKISKALDISVDTLILDGLYNTAAFSFSCSTEKKIFIEYLSSLGIQLDGVFANNLDPNGENVIKLVYTNIMSNYSLSKSELIITEQDFERIENEIAEFTKRIISLLSQEIDKKHLIRLKPLKNDGESSNGQ
ncbi:helix-turn-helix transcriptional regulator [Aminipila butyrica]|uniref:Helix-turn-helix transcriptional regulator n=1 Tax=Aminipila butyrica TaxID=433296 RepID=A0A858BWV5_9FIRM|nr:helix-turn-helix transcriptional regulator [Aminipila butyrica]QIB68566.1 helix-turn-helix transcriptional regulator [Aminipila butyrica]